MLLKQSKEANSVSQSNFHRNNQTEGSVEARKTNGVVYTPKVLADYVARKVTELYLGDYPSSKFSDTVRVLDPACGKGELLESIWHSLMDSTSSHNCVANSMLFGVDIDKHALDFTYKRITGLSSKLKSIAPRLQVLNTNALFPFNSATSHQGWTRVKRKFHTISGFDIIIANPPWGADISEHRHKLCPSEFSLFRGQFDSSDLFLESAIANLRSGGYLAFIVPDSLFSQEREPLRKLLLKKTEIRFIGRLGEKFFCNINRACAVIICKKDSRKSKRKVQCLRLTQKARRQILSGELGFALAEKKLSYFVDLSRFQKNYACLFNIDLSPKEENIILTMSSVGSTLRDHLVSTRGVELSKKGKVYQCSSCAKWAPYPASNVMTCRHCGISLSREHVLTTSIISRKEQPGHQPILVGESVSRYSVSRSYWIDTGKYGISYKDASIFQPAKLLVRKTGVGLSVAIDYSQALTNQVVYILRTIKENNVPLEFYLGLLASRAVYFYIAKTHGETEWRSHPYLTQKQLMEIPVPSLDSLSKRHCQQVKSIVRTLQKYVYLEEPPSIDDEAYIERMVAEIYGLTPQDYEAIFRTITDAQDLIPIRVLRTINTADIFLHSNT